MNTEICRKIKQADGKGEPFYASIPNKFPATGIYEVSQSTILKAGVADRLVGKLDGIIHTLPDIEFFIKMYTIKDATSSAQIEGTKATMVDAIEMKVGINNNSTDAEAFFII